MKLYKLRPWLFQRGRFAHYSLDEKLRMLMEHKISYVINLSPRADSELAKALGSGYIHCPVPDSPHADFASIEQVVKTLRIDKLLGSKGGILVHCNAGRNRSSLVSAMLLMDREGLTATQAIAQLRRLRPNALATPAFCDYLLKRRTNERHTSDTRPRRSR